MAISSMGWDDATRKASYPENVFSKSHATLAPALNSSVDLDETIGYSNRYRPGHRSRSGHLRKF
jgi:hypothetical protein